MSDKNKKEEVVKDFFGNPKAVIKKDENGNARVTTWTGKLLGTADKNGTFDPQGKPIAKGFHPELLVPDEE